MSPSARPPTTIQRVRSEDLTTDERLGELYVQAVQYGYWPNSPHAALEFVALAEKALEDDTCGTPAALFYSLIKNKDGSMVTQAAETRAMRRFPSNVRQGLVDAAAAISMPLAMPPVDEVQDALVPQDVGYMHAVLMQCFLPHRPTHARRYETSHGNASLVVHAGELANPNVRRGWIECQIPAGAKPRLILPYIIGEAIRNASPEINLGRSLRQFMTSLNVPIAGTNAKALTAQIENIAAAHIVIGEWTVGAVHTRGGRFAKELSFWLERNPDQRTLWTPTMTLSDEFFNTIQHHRVPIDTGHLAQLARSPRRMDLYAWLSYRTARIPARRREPISLRALHAIFAPDISRYADFTARLRRDLKAIYTVYPFFKVELASDILWLERSPPPVPFTTQIPSRQLPPATPTAKVCESVTGPPQKRVKVSPKCVKVSREDGPDHA